MNNLTATPRSEQEDLADELADVLFVLICLANQTGIDLDTAFQKNLEKKTARDFDRHQQNDKLKVSKIPTMKILSDFNLTVDPDEVKQLLEKIRDSHSTWRQIRNF